MIRLYDFDEVKPEEILNRDIRAEADVEATVDAIIADVRARGDAALLDYAAKFDHAQLTSVQVTQAEIDEAFSELEAIQHIFDELEGTEGILVASKIADRVGITRSVIVNALRKFESAGVIESRSSGMKGTYITVLNEVIFDELDEIKKRKIVKNNK